jgi:hypothetical protein
MPWSKLIDMARTDDDDDYLNPLPRAKRPEYPWMLRISLCESQLKKLCLCCDEAEVGNELEFRAFATVTNVSHEQLRDGEDRHQVTLQIEKMSVETEQAAGGWTQLESMEMDDEDQYDSPCCGPMSTKPLYPPGLVISLGEKELGPLGLNPDPNVGDLLDMKCVASVTSISKNKTADGKEHERVELQIEKISVEDELRE